MSALAHAERFDEVIESFAVLAELEWAALGEGEERDDLERIASDARAAADALRAEAPPRPGRRPIPEPSPFPGMIGVIVDVVRERRIAPLVREHEAALEAYFAWGRRVEDDHATWEDAVQSWRRTLSDSRLHALRADRDAALRLLDERGLRNHVEDVPPPFGWYVIRASLAHT